ncbi:alpha/beta hydrolase [Aeromicrobium phragmitis]|uniref:Alpha/beta hydrolase n=1 Tax=Aeromicrobium phragmitis TaxID=2478914 RepID=A0A3L8PLM1_9ACTN|nr:alpha/beta hydrolase [Aeromicrobium phragmitis]RLV56160.1 alpha/beta hydrolase [Aeromicrobium phragmitis]
MVLRRVLLVLTMGLAGLAVAVWRSPRVGSALIRWVFTRGGEHTVATLQPFVPPGVDGRRELAYGPGPAERLDVWFPAGTDRPLPTVVWVHGGGWVAGSTADVEPYAKIIAAEGYTVVAVDYALAPAARYPMPLRQVGAALSWLTDHADELRVDIDRLVLAGDSAGAQISAQLAIAITDPAYASRIGIDPTVAAPQLRGVISHCGPQLPELLEDAHGVEGWFIRTIGRAYFATSSFDEPHVHDASVADQVGPAYPPTLVTGGNADPLTRQGKAFAERLAAAGVDVTALFWPDDYTPALQHEFQFDLRLEAAQETLAATRDFLARVMR